MTAPAPHHAPAPAAGRTADPPAVVLAAEAVHKTYRMGPEDVPVLRGASLHVRRAECVAVLGASGSGKSTLLHILGGLDRPDRRSRSAANGGGDILFEGRSLARLSQSELDAYRNTKVGFVFQFYHLLPELSVLENVTIGAMVRYGRWGFRRRSRQVAAAAADLLSSFGLGHRLRHRPSQLSGGERQRVAIARALINDPPVLLADEPTGNLDRKTGESILDSLLSLRHASSRTMVIVTHDHSVAARADRVVYIDDGRVTDRPPPA